MNLVIQADWPLPEADIAFASKQVYEALAEVLPYLNRVLSHRNLPTLAPNHWQHWFGGLIVHLHSGDVPYNGGFVDGLYWPSPRLIELDWPAEMSGRRILRHECGHFSAEVSGLADWGHFGHGGRLDPIHQTIKHDLEFLYHGDSKLFHNGVEV